MAGFSAFLKFDDPGFQGGSQDKDHLGWLDIVSWSLSEAPVAEVVYRRDPGPPVIARRAGYGPKSIEFRIPPGQGSAFFKSAFSAFIETNTFPGAFLALPGGRPGQGHWFAFSEVHPIKHVQGARSSSGGLVDIFEMDFGDVHHHQGPFVAALAKTHGAAHASTALSMLRQLKGK